MKVIQNNLKPCPFCGGKVSVEKGFGGITFFECRKCGATVSFKDKGSSMEVLNPVFAWNNRANEARFSGDGE